MNPVSVPSPAVAPIAPPVIPTEFVPPTQFTPPASIPPPTMQHGGSVAGSMMSFSAASAAKVSSKNELPMQFTTPSGEISWISLMLLGLFIVGTSYQIILAHQQITKHKDDDDKIAELQKRVTTLEAMKRAA